MSIGKQFASSAAVFGVMVFTGCEKPPSHPLLPQITRDTAVGPIYQEIIKRDAPELAINQMFPLKNDDGKTIGILFVDNFQYVYSSTEYADKETACLKYHIWNGGGNGADIVSGERCDPVEPKKASAKVKAPSFQQ